MTDQYNAWLEENVPDRQLAKIRAEVGDDRVPRLAPEEFEEACEVGCLVPAPDPLCEPQQA